MTRSKPLQSLPYQQTANATNAADEKGAASDPKLVELIANGTHAVPSALSDSDAGQLCEHVSRIRRSRLIRWIARCLADRLLEEHQADRKEPTDE